MPFLAGPAALPRGYESSGTLAQVPGSYSVMPQGVPLKGPELEEQPRRSSGWGTKCVVFTLLSVFLLEVAGIAIVAHCRGVPVDRTSQAVPLLDQLGGKGMYQASNLPGRRDPKLFKECEAGALNQTVRDGMVFGYAKPAAALELLYRCTRIPGLIEHVPELLRGVFWMKGNSLPEELAVLQMGQWFEEERTYIFPSPPSCGHGLRAGIWRAAVLHFWLKHATR